jgi:hypothetical protein
MMKSYTTYGIALLLIVQWFGSELMAQPRQITGFDTLMKALFSGENVRVIIRYAQCNRSEKGEAGDRSRDVVAGMAIGTFEYFAEGVIPGSPAFVTFSESKLILNPIGKGHVFNYGKVRVMAGNAVTVTAQYLDPKRYKVLMDQTYKGTINDGLNNGGIYFFRSGDGP